ncbi:MAG: Smr/MutS family protein, partial [bacterium]
RAAGPDLVHLKELAEAMTGLPRWEAWIQKGISEKGEVLDAASAEVASARRDLRAAREAVISRLERFMGTRAVSKVMQEPYVTLRNDRYVVPARPEYHRVFEGVVQDSSQSGQTVFVEPLFAVQLNNRHAAAHAAEQEAVFRTLAAMTEEARQNRGHMAANQELLARLDLALARARLGRRLQGTLPAFDAVRTDLREARHPLLALDPEGPCVPIDIGIGGGTTTLVITGPNTGGKTVALKTLGLLTAMAQSGIPVPVSDQSRFRIFKRVFADIGDEQSISQNLSTFSGHMVIIAGLLQAADDQTLVLLDELGAGTDTQEGSALGMALLEALNERGACSVVTTHHNLLKDFAYRAPFASNASTVFDEGTLEPTYRLRMGAPGRSHALQVAGRLGLEQAVIRRAQVLMGSGTVRVDELLARLTGELDRESEARQRAEFAAEALEKERERQRSEEEESRKRIREAVEKTRQEARGLLRDIERRGREILRDLKGRDTEGARVALRQSLDDIRKEVSRRMPPPPAGKGGGPVQAGDTVRILPLGVVGTVETVASGGSEAEVVSGGIRMKVPVSDLGAVGPGESPAAPGPPGAGVAYEKGSDVQREINLLGSTVEEALASVDRLLDRSLLESGLSLRIVHGKGTGALKKAISEALRRDPRVAAFGPAPLEQGGAGVTIVQLKE